MTGNTSAAVPTCQFQADPVSYCSIASMPPTNFGTPVSHNFYYTSNIVPQNVQQFQHTVNPNNSVDTHIYYPNYTNHNFYDPSQNAISHTVDPEIFGYPIPKTSEELQFEQQSVPVEMNRV